MKWIKERGPVVAFEGRLDKETVPEARRRVLKALKRNPAGSLDVDLSRLERMDTAGVALLVELHRNALRKGGKVRLRGLNEGARRMIQLARLDQVLEVAEEA
ncbi:STAS domain-containing protein [Desulfoglaeba alkanexedens]|uniref:Anti-sigma factor antagonist n=1 Tax=Desulfoglaeba alkanexedens ALDC TaxID=980445 RepID=A0A4P8L0G1_9BACT|nr:STAS domain-containing protein [Desulfoglaeba alkanexedens]QCQ21200.1 STAS domain-containing protein [Desulfoglaeba alkanexedens ALDC]